MLDNILPPGLRKARSRESVSEQDDVVFLNELLDNYRTYTKDLRVRSLISHSNEWINELIFFN